MANKTQTVTLRGKVMYAKVLGDPVPNFNKDGREWKLDFIPNDQKSAKADLKGLGVADRLRIKDGYADNQPYMSFKQSEFKANGDPNARIEVKDILGKDWEQDKLIGNGSVVDMRFVVIDYGPGKKPGCYPRSLRVLDLVPYEKQEFTPIDETDEYYLKAQEVANAVSHDTFKEDFGLEDDLDDELPV